MKRWSDWFIGSATLGFVVLFVAACPSSSGRNGGTTVDPTKTSEEGDYSAETKADFAVAYKTYEQAIQGGLEEDECERVAEAFEEVHEDSGVGVPEALFNAGLVWDKCGNTKRSADYLEDANEIAKAQAVARLKAAGKSTSDAAPGYAPAYILLGAHAYREGNKTQAKRMFDNARESDRRSTEAYTNLGVLQREQKQWAEAQLNLRRALAVNSDFMTAFAQMALLYLEVADDNEQMLDIVELVSQQATARAVEIKSDPLIVAPIHNIWGLALVRKGDVVRAVEQFNKARRLNPEFFEAHMNYGAVNLSFRGFAEAEKAFRAAIGLRPDDFQAHLSLGASLRGLERYDEARTEYEKARQLDPASPGAYYNLAVLMQDYEMATAGDMDAQIALLGKATQVYREFIQKCGSNREACVRKRPGEEDRDMRDRAEERIKACKQTISGLREAQELAAEVAQMEAEAQAQQEAAPPPEEGEGGESGDDAEAGGGAEEGADEEAGEE